MSSNCSKLCYRKRSTEGQIKAQLKEKNAQALQVLNLAKAEP